MTENYGLPGLVLYSQFILNELVIAHNDYTEYVTE